MALGSALDPRRLAHRLLHLREARLALPRFALRPATQKHPPGKVQRKPELLGESPHFSDAFPRPVELAALDMDNSTPEESVRKTERMFHALGQCYGRLAQSQRPVGMANVQVTQGRMVAEDDATIESHRVRQRPMRAGIV